MQEDEVYGPKADRQARRGGWWSLAINVGLTVSKIAVGLTAESPALFADGVHSAADVVGSVAVMVGLWIGRKPADADHPYGHGKAELLSSGIVAGVLLAAGVEIAVEAVRSFWGRPVAPGLAAAWTAVGAILVKEWLYHYNYRLGRRLHSRSLLASAADHRSDVLSSSAALIGILLSILGASWHIGWMLYMDSVASAAVAVLVVKMGYEIAVDAVHVLMDRVMEGDEILPYRDQIAAVAGVRRIDVLRVRDHGQYVIIDVEISVLGDLSVSAGHVIATRVKEELMQQFPMVRDVWVHVNPVEAKERRNGFPRL
ncbi:cation transporter [Alicyclobacillaceae bacterium I2511]|nr:cation transporter [Alicyclobacillaceae bacterium I2511]